MSRENRPVYDGIVSGFLVNMNGRVYDPQLARFMSADPNIQAPGNGQSFNRYSYVLNNPLSYTDPTGYRFLPGLTNSWKKVWHSEVGRAVVSIAAAYFTAGYAASLTWGNEVIAGMAGGFSGSLVGSGGNLKAGIIGGVTGGVAGNISSIYGDTWNWQRVGANSFAGGVGSELNGGQFKDGFKSSFALSSLTYANYSMRQEMVAQSSLNPDNINGESDGFFQDGKKLAGSRRTIGFDGGYLTCDSLMGGCQGAPIRPGDVRSSFFGMEYGSGSLPDRTNEAWAGPHDWFRNATGSYDSLGNAVNFTGFRAVADSVMNYALVIPATPLAVSALITTTPGSLAILSQIK